MGPPLPLGCSGLASPHSQGPFIFNDPLNGFPLLYFQGLSQRSRTNQIKLPLPLGPFNHLDFGQVSHGKRLLSKMLKGVYHSYIAMSSIFYPFSIFSHLPFVKRGKPLLLPLAKGEGLPARSRFGEGRGGILQVFFKQLKCYNILTSHVVNASPKGVPVR
jgi:hypothetical protein